MTALAPLSVDAYLPALPELAADLGGGAQAGQVTLTACLAGLAFGQLVAGPISDRRGRRDPLLAGLAGFAVASVLCAAAPSVELMVASRFAQGASAAAAIVLSRAVAADLHKGPERIRIYGSLVAVAGAVPVLAPIGGAVLLEVGSWRTVFIAEAVVGALLAVAVARGLVETHPSVLRKPNPGSLSTVFTLGVLARDRLFVGYAAVQGLAFAAMFACIATTPFLVQVRYGMSAQVFSLIFAVYALGLAACAKAGPTLLMGSRSERQLLRLALTVLGGGACALGAGVSLGGSAWIVLPTLLVVVSSIGLVLPPATTLALADSSSADFGSASAALGFTQFAIGGAIVPLTGAMGERSVIPLAIIVATLALAASLAFVTTSAAPTRTT